MSVAVDACRVRALVRWVVLAIAMLLVGAAPAVAHTLSGTVTADGGLTMSGVAVEVVPTEGGAPVATSTTGMGGDYSVDVTSGTYHVGFTPPVGTGYARFEARDLVIDRDRVLDVRLVPDDARSFSGVVRGGGGAPLSGVLLNMAGQSVTSSAEGEFVLSASAGVHRLAMSRRFGNGRMEVQADVDLRGGPVASDVRLPVFEVDVTTVGPSGSAIGGVELELPNYSVPAADLGQLSDSSLVTAHAGFSYSEWFGETRTGVDGRGSVHALRRSTPVTLTATPPAATGLAQVQVSIPSITADRELTVELAPGRSFSGVVRGGGGAPLSGVLLNMAGQSVTSSAEGEFVLSASAGVHRLAMSRRFGNGRMEVQADVDLRGGPVASDVRLPVFEVDVTTVGPSGSAIGGVELELPNYSVPAADLGQLSDSSLVTAHAGFSYSEWFGETRTGVDGRGSVHALRRSTPVTLTATPPAATGLAQVQVSIPSITADRELTVELAPGRSFSGVVRGGGGAPLSGVLLNMAGQSVTSSAEGEFVLSASAGVHRLAMSRRFGNGRMEVQADVDLRGGPVASDVRLPVFEVDVTTVGPSGSAIGGVALELPNYSVPAADLGQLSDSSLVTAHAGFSYSEWFGETRTGVDGRGSVHALRRSTPVTLTATPPAATGLAQVQVSIPSITADRGQLIAFQRSSIDPTPPTVSCEAAGSVWRSVNATVQCSASDSGLGLRTQADASFSLSTDVADGIELDNASTTTRRVCDLADNCSTAVVSGFKIDRRAPVVEFEGVTDGQRIALGTDLTLRYTCRDGGAGVASCVGSRPSGARIDTSQLGVVAIDVVARDALGNERTQTLRVTVFEPDVTPPVIECEPLGSTVFGVNVSVRCGADDGSGGSGLADASDAEFVLATDVPEGEERDEVAFSERQVCDVEGNCTAAIVSVRITVDRRDPRLTVTAEPDGDEGWHRTSEVADVRAEDLTLRGLTCEVDGVPVDLGSLSGRLRTAIVHAGDGVHRVACTAIDAVERQVTEVVDIKVDTRPPVIDAELPERIAVNAAATLHYDCDDATSGVRLCTGDLPAGATLDTSALGVHKLTLRARDVAGNAVTREVSYEVVDVTPPTQSVALSPAANQAGWHAADVTVQLRATDPVPGTGVASFGVQGLPGGDEVLDAIGGGVDVPIAVEGRFTLSISARDQAGNAAEPETVVVAVDKTRPQVALATGGVLATDLTAARMTGTARDSRSGVAAVEVAFKPLIGPVVRRTATCSAGCDTTDWSWSVSTAGLIPGVYDVTATARDAAGNSATSARVSAAVTGLALTR